MSFSFDQGDILKVEHIRYPLLVVSKNTFNKTGYAVCCPILRDILPGPLHIRIDTAQTSGIVLCEQMKYLDLRLRGYSRTDCLSLNLIIEITDAIQSIFDYY